MGHVGTIPPLKLSEQASHLSLLLRAISILGDKSSMLFPISPFACFQITPGRELARETFTKMGQTSLRKYQNIFTITQM